VSTDREALRLRDIVENVDRIKTHLSGLDRDELARDAKTIDAIERCLQRITEAVVKIGAVRIAAISPQTSVAAVRGLGNMLRHAYDEIDLDVILSTVREDLPGLREDCIRALDRSD
jgi:uncharacterized protein with HEPN domain